MMWLYFMMMSWKRRQLHRVHRDELSCWSPLLLFVIQLELFTGERQPAVAWYAWKGKDGFCPFRAQKHWRYQNSCRRYRLTGFAQKESLVECFISSRFQSPILMSNCFAPSILQSAPDFANFDPRYDWALSFCLSMTSSQSWNLDSLWFPVLDPHLLSIWKSWALYHQKMLISHLKCFIWSSSHFSI